MRIFISWSGEKSNRVAQLLREWFPAVIQAARPYFSPEDIAKGARWNTEVSVQLQEAKVGILCVTAENLAAPWLLFEAGALAKSLDQARVIPLLVDVEPSALAGPLAQFQAARFEKSELRRVVKVINDQLAAAALTDGVLDSVFDKWWPELETKLAAIRESIPHRRKLPLRTDRELLEEVLGIVRDLNFRPTWVSANVVDFNRVVSQPIEALQLTDRTLTAAHEAGIRTIEDALSWSESKLLKTPNMRRVCLNELKEALASKGLTLAPERPTSGQ